MVCTAAGSASLDTALLLMQVNSVVVNEAAAEYVVATQSHAAGAFVHLVEGWSNCCVPSHAFLIGIWNAC